MRSQEEIAGWEYMLEIAKREATEEGCECRLGIRNLYSADWVQPEITILDDRGCPVHCSHRGIAYGGRCYCGAIV